jgi:hypothetical protein
MVTTVEHQEQARRLGHHHDREAGADHQRSAHPRRVADLRVALAQGQAGDLIARDPAVAVA